ncbi:hypothetical protein SAMN04488009_2917 [Maribacter sedimenticola]|uniref:Lipoprotein n=1 Tax=Maribacter sedimenticola TaxID=228956 RepID=A0ABY1SJE9_9FLAO|nr:hypothetical protein [Maribacter sedimenticola]SNR64247.1 hypothetical protein SAMN04488009_2917 [Maribacter sedimenticola]
MKKAVLIFLLILISCESKEKIEEEIALLKVELLELHSHDAILNYNNAVNNLKNQQWEVEFNKKELEKERMRTPSIAALIDLYSTKLKGAEKRVFTARKRVEHLKIANDDVFELIILKEKKLEELKSKLK